MSGRQARTRFKGGVLVDEVRMSPVDRYQRRFRRFVICGLVLVAIIVLAFAMR
jgi:hypothetical protein